MSNGNDSGVKGDYQVVIDVDSITQEEKKGLIGSGGGERSSNNNTPAPLEIVVNHSALPVLCYCAASISMTVINKVSTTFDKKK